MPSLHPASLVLAVTALVVTPVDSATALAFCGDEAVPPTRLVALSSAGCPLTGRVVRSGAADVLVPPPGNTVTTYVLTTTGEDYLSVSVDASGRVSFDDSRTSSSDVAPKTQVAAVPPPEECFSSANQQAGAGRRPEDRALVWFYNGANEPRPGYYSAVWFGADNMTYGINDCGLAPFRFGITHVANPGSPARANMGSDGICSFFGHDSLNVVDWGALPDGVLARSCSFTIATVPCVLAGKCITESDVRFNPGVRWMVVDEIAEPGVEPLCIDQFDLGGYDLMSVSAHEFGHVWGLGDVDAGTDPRMTMSGHTGHCDFSGRFIGLGDYVGMCDRWCPGLVNPALADRKDTP